MRLIVFCALSVICASLLFGAAEATFVCKECEKLANDILAVAENNSTFATLRTDLENICTTVLDFKPAQELCIEAVDGIINDLQYTGQFRMPRHTLLSS